LCHELVLEGLRRGRDHDGASSGGGGDEVAEGLACSRSGLHDEVPLSQEGIHHRSNHLLLPSAQLASAWEMAGDFVQ